MAVLRYHRGFTPLARACAAGACRRARCECTTLSLGVVTVRPGTFTRPEEVVTAAATAGTDAKNEAKQVARHEAEHEAEHEAKRSSLGIAIEGAPARGATLAAHVQSPQAEAFPQP